MPPARSAVSDVLQQCIRGGRRWDCHTASALKCKTTLCRRVQALQAVLEGGILTEGGTDRLQGGTGLSPAAYRYHIVSPPVPPEPARFRSAVPLYRLYHRVIDLADSAAEFVPEVAGRAASHTTQARGLRRHCNRRDLLRQGPSGWKYMLLKMGRETSGCTGASHPQGRAVEEKAHAGGRPTGSLCPTWPRLPRTRAGHLPKVEREPRGAERHRKLPPINTSLSLL